MKRKVLVLASLVTILGASQLKAQLNVGSTAAPASTLQVNGSFQTTFTAITANTTLDATHHTLNVSNGITVTLPAASAAIMGRQYVIRCLNGTGNTATINAGGSTITTATGPGFTTLVLQSNECVTVVYGNLNWVLTNDYFGTAAPTNIYNADGTLTGARTVTQAGNFLAFNGGNVGFGASSGTAVVNVDGPTTNLLDLHNYMGTTPNPQGATVRTFGVRGTVAAPTATQITDGLGTYRFGGYDGSAFTTAKAAITSAAAENWTPTTTGANLAFATTHAGGTALLTRMMIADNGNIGINTFTPASTLHINGSIQTAFATLSVNTTLDSTYHTVNVSTVGTVITLPVATAAITGRQYIIRCTPGVASITINGNGANVVSAEGIVATTYVLTTSQSATLVYNGTNWITTSFVTAPNYWTLAGSSLYNNAGTNVGIGTTAPLQALHVRGITPQAIITSSAIPTAGSFISLFGMGANNGGASDYQSVGLNAAATEAWTTTASGGRLSVIVTPNGTVTRTLAMTVDNTGYVGIGVTSPLQLLHVRGTSPQAIVTSSAIPASGSFIGLFGVGANNGGASDYQSAGINAYATEAWTTAASGSRLAFITTGNGTTARAERMTVDNAGYVGIGINSPVTRLHVKNPSGSSAFPATSGTTQSVGHFARFEDGSNLSLDMGGFGANGSWLQSTDRTNLGSTYPLLLNPNGGNVGIGTTLPVARLNVAQDVSDNSNGQLLVGGATVTGKNLILGYNTTNNNAFIQGNFANNSYSNLLLNPSGANVGIGTGSTAPSARLEINSGVAGTSGLKFTNLTSATAASAATTGALGVDASGNVVVVNPTTIKIITGTSGAFREFSASSQVIAASGGVAAAVVTNSESYDELNEFTSGVFTPSQAGTWLLEGSMTGAPANGSGNWSSYIQKSTDGGSTWIPFAEADNFIAYPYSVTTNATFLVTVSVGEKYRFALQPCGSCGTSAFTFSNISFIGLRLR